jgi:hypothetical protein
LANEEEIEEEMRRNLKKKVLNVVFDASLLIL